MIPRLDRFAWVALLCCAFSVCTTRPIDKRIKESETQPTFVSSKFDKCDALLSRIDEVSAKSESLSNAMDAAIKRENRRRVVEIRAAEKDTTEFIETHQSPHGKWFEQ